MAAVPLPTLTLEDGVVKDQIDPSKVVDDWLSKLEKHFEDGTLSKASDLFIEECWWRDNVALTWDIAAKQGFPAILKHLEESDARPTQFKASQAAIAKPTLVEMGLTWIQSAFTFETAYGSASGFLRLANRGPLEWKAWIVFTKLDSLNDRSRKDSGVGANGTAVEKKEPQVVIVGAGLSVIFTLLRPMNADTVLQGKPESRSGRV